MAFDVEDIPDNARLFRRINEIHFLSGGEISSAAFNDPEMSVNWEKYSDAASAADEKSACITSLMAGECRKLEQNVIHCPIEADEPFGPNRSHSEVRGNKKKSVCRKLRDIATIVWIKNA